MPEPQDLLHFRPEWSRVTLARMTDAVITTDTAGRVTFLNPVAESLTGWTQGEAAGVPLENVFRIVHPETRQTIESPTVRALREGVNVGLTNRTLLIAKDGTELPIGPIDDSAAPIRDDQGELAGVVLVFRDITELCRLEKQLQEQAVAAADMDRRKDEFLAMLSHELRNPLAPISNAVHLLRLQKNEEPLQQKARTIIERQVVQLTRLVDDLMEVSRITTGRVQLRLDRVVLSGIVERAVEAARPLIDQRRHELTVSLPPQPIWLNADASRLEQVIVNLLANAAKYTDEGGHMWLTVHENGTDCVLGVRDTGVGIAPDLLPRIFDLFTQAERSLDRSQGGFGIGLALVQRLVEMHSGKVEVRSSLGQGSEFVVRLPMLLTTGPHSPSFPAEKATPAGPALRILVVDDNVDTAGSLAMLLAASGHDVRMAHDGPTAVESALEYRPNVMLLDLGLPGFDGYEVAKRMRQRAGFQNVVLVAMTGHGLDADRQRSQDALFDHYFVKPVDFGMVQEILATISVEAA